MSNQNRHIDKYFNQLIYFGGYGLPRWFVIQELEEWVLPKALQNYFLTKEVGAKEVLSLMDLNDYLKHKSLGWV